MNGLILDHRLALGSQRERSARRRSTAPAFQHASRSVHEDTKGLHLVHLVFATGILTPTRPRASEHGGRRFARGRMRDVEFPIERTTVSEAHIGDSGLASGGHRMNVDALNRNRLAARIGLAFLTFDRPSVVEL